MWAVEITPATSLTGEVAVPGDKSISHRAAMLAAIAEGTSRITNFAASADCRSTLECLVRLGVDVRHDNGDIVVKGRGKHGLSPPQESLDCGNSGTTMRLLSGILAGQPFTAVLTGDDSLRSRPMRRVIEPLTRMGARIESAGGTAPLTIYGRQPLDAIDYTLPVASAQIKSAVLLGGLYAAGLTTVVERTESRDHTERMLKWLGANVDVITDEAGDRRVSVQGDTTLSAHDIIVPGDISAAAFFLVAAACIEDSDITIPRVGMNPTRQAICDVLAALGVAIEVSPTDALSNEPVADIRVRGGLRPSEDMTVIGGKTIANLIDEVPILAVLGSQLSQGLEVRDAAELRVKETDRIKAVCTNLAAMGATVIEYSDGFRIEGSQRLKGARVESYGDHRIAMSFAVAGLLATGTTEIAGSDCVRVSFPGFFESLKAVVR